MDQQLIAAAGAQTAGTVRVNMLANLEALLNIGASSVEVIAIVVGVILFVVGLRTADSASFATSDELMRRARFKRQFGFFLVKFGLFFPFGVNWLVAWARDAGLFS
ncbi:MAG: hypothetical protein JSS86_16215 [Cyanobacteria bacterium SZAS LIN-2]|nr:hypothetical protein [Cyanobacteria bacterium SZAS LIN-2]